jgi:hypothetical protein
MQIKETMEVLEFAKVALAKAVEAKQNDGKISSSEALQILFQSAPAGVAAFVGSQLVPAELKELDTDEVQQLAGAGLEIAQLLMVLFTPSGV